MRPTTRIRACSTGSSNNRTYVNVTATRFKVDQHDDGTFSTAVRHTFQASNFQFTDIPPSLQNVNGFADNPSSSQFVRGGLSRFNFNVDASRYGNWHGAHMVKGGLQVERIVDDTLSGEQAATVQLFWDQSYALNDGRRIRGTYGYYNVVRFVTIGDIESNNVGLFVQDSWTLNRKLTLNLGIRTESEDVPSYRPDNPGVHFGFGDKLAPRVGFAYDLHGDSQWKLYGSWGVFYDLMKLTVGRVMFGGDNWVNYYYTLDNSNWPAISCGDGAPGSGCPGTFITQFDFRPVANNPTHDLVDPDLKAARSQEFTLGLDHELTRTMSLGVRYAHKWVDYAIEAVCNFTASGEEDCGVNNPGFGSELGTYPLGRSNPAQPAAVRDYDGLEIRLRKRLANRWSADVSYLYSQLRGNWSGIASSDEAVGSLQPNSGRSFNLLYYSYDAQGNVSVGPPGNRPAASVQGAGHLRLRVGHDGRRQRARRKRRPTVDDHEPEEHQFLPVRARRPGPDADVLSGGPADPAGAAVAEADAGDDRPERVQSVRSEDSHRLPGDTLSRSVQRERCHVLWRVRSGRRRDGSELPQRCALRHGERLSGFPGDSFPGARQLLTREHRNENGANRQSAIGNL